MVLNDMVVILATQTLDGYVCHVFLPCVRGKLIRCFLTRLPLFTVESETNF